MTRRSTLLSACAAFSSYKQHLLGCNFEAGVLVACKADRRSEAEVSEEEGRERAAELGLDYIETSAANGDGVESVFEKIAAQVASRHEILRRSLQEANGDASQDE
jgi:50S ribosomal subunit-associated GTPase HflX